MNALTKKRFSDTTRDDIIAYLEAGGDSNTHGIVLTDKQTALLDRWRYADEKLRENKYKREKIAELIIGRWNVSRDTAWRDIVNAEYVLCSCYPLTKKYEIQRRIEFLKEEIYNAKLDKDRDNISKLEKVLMEYYKLYPEASRKQSPKTIIFNIQNNLLVVEKTAEQACAESDELIKLLEENDDY